MSVSDKDRRPLAFFVEGHIGLPIRISALLIKELSDESQTHRSRKQGRKRPY
jgi:hypothetical protein